MIKIDIIDFTNDCHYLIMKVENDKNEEILFPKGGVYVETYRKIGKRK